MNTLLIKIVIGALLFSTIILPPNLATAFTDEPGNEGSFYSPIVRVVADTGFILITTGNGILWLKASKAAKPHLGKLPIGGMIDIVVEFQGKPNPPVIKSWKLASGDSSCDIFDGKACLSTKKSP